LNEAIGKHVEANPQDFTGDYSVHANIGADPMKLSMVIWWSYLYNGAQPALCTFCLNETHARLDS
jgi:hypothetical protein